MIRKLLFALVGALLSSTIFGLALYLSGLYFESKGIYLYRSEADQQRNFNIVFVLWIGFALIGGWIGYQANKKRSK